jgi:hypothetical protein
LWIRNSLPLVHFEEAVDDEEEFRKRVVTSL